MQFAKTCKKYTNNVNLYTFIVFVDYCSDKYLERGRTMKKILCVLCVFAMMLTLVPFGVSAAEPQYYGDLEYKIEDGVAIITGIKKYADNDVVIPATIDECPVVEIGERAFYENEEMKTITLPDSLMVIGEGAFYGCKNLKSVVIPDSVRDIKSDGFLGAFAYCVKLEEVVIGEGVTIVNDRTFAGCENLENITFGSNIDTIGGYAFQNCEKLKEVNLPDKLETIGAYAFRKSGLLKLDLPDSATVIDERAFEECAGLSELNLNKVEDIGDYAFYKCTSLTELTVPDSVSSMGVYAFSECTNVKYLTLGGGLKTIPERAFDGLINLEKMYITGGNLNLMENGAFDVYTKVMFGDPYHNMTDVFFSGTKEEWDDITKTDLGNEIFVDENVNIQYEIPYSEDIFDAKGILGDVNGDEKVNIKDATMIQKAAAKILSLTDDENLRANVNGDNKVNVKDATAIQKFVAKIETGFPIGEKIA